MIPDITITDHVTCGDVLIAGSCWDDEEEVHLYGPFDNVISIVGTWGFDHEDDPPGGWKVWTAYPARKLRLQFDDVQRDSSHGEAPKAEHIQQIIDFCDGLEGRTIIHCAAGVSRSTATGFIVLATLLGPEREEEALKILLSRKKHLRPHRNMVRMADELLGREGALVKVYESAWGVE